MDETACKTYQVSFRVDVPEEIQKEEVENWLRFELGETASMNMDNPLASVDLEANSWSILVE